MLLAMEKHIMIAHGFCWQFQSDLRHSLVPTCANNESSPKAMLVMWRCARCSFAACAAQNVPAWPDVTCDTWGSKILQPAVAQPRGGARNWCYESAGFVSPRRQSWPSSTGNCASNSTSHLQWISMNSASAVPNRRKCGENGASLHVLGSLMSIYHFHFSLFLLMSSFPSQKVGSMRTTTNQSTAIMNFQQDRIVS